MGDQYEREGHILILSTRSFGAGHLFSDSGRDAWWHKTWAVKGSTEAIEVKWAEMGEEEVPIPCLLYIDETGWVLYASPEPLEEFRWILSEITRTGGGGIHVPCEIVRATWLDPTAEEGRYSWRLRVCADAHNQYFQTSS